MAKQREKGFGTLPVFLTAISTILGAILFLRFGYAVGMLGFWGVILIIFLGHTVTIPTALALSELATNQRVEGGGEYYIISRSFGLNIGATIGISLFMSQAISVAFYVIAFTEAFEPVFNRLSERYNMDLPRQVISFLAVCRLPYPRVLSPMISDIARVDNVPICRQSAHRGRDPVHRRRLSASSPAAMLSRLTDRENILSYSDGSVRFLRERRVLCGSLEIEPSRRSGIRLFDAYRY